MGASSMESRGRRDRTPGPADGSSPHTRGRRRAAGIYGTVVTAAVIAAGGGQLRTTALAVTVVVTLVVYWLAEEYAELLGEHTRAGHLPSVAIVRSSLAGAWPMVTASFLPLAALLVARLLGASSVDAAWFALSTAVALLVVHGYGAAERPTWSVSAWLQSLLPLACSGWRWSCSRLFCSTTTIDRRAREGPFMSRPCHRTSRRG